MLASTKDVLSLLLTKHEVTSLTNASHAWRGHQQLPSPLVQFILGEAGTQGHMMVTVILPWTWFHIWTVLQMTRNTVCKTSGSWFQTKGSLQGSVSLPFSEPLPALLRCWILEIWVRASVDLTVFYSASVYKKPSSFQVLMCYINALKNKKAGNISAWM